MKRILSILALSLFATAAHAQVVLNFEGVNATYPRSPLVLPLTSVGDFYNGGTSSAGTSGVNHGVTFSSNALGLCLSAFGMTQYECSNSSRGGQGDPNSQQGGLYFDHAGPAYINMASGFQTGFSFFYASYSPFSVNVWDGLSGTGTLLGTIALPTHEVGCASYGAGLCPFNAAGLNFAGTAKSVTFTGVNDEKVLDDVTFGSAIPGAQVVPEPATIALLAAGLTATAAVARRRRRKQH